MSVGKTNRFQYYYAYRSPGDSSCQPLTADTQRCCCCVKTIKLAIFWFRFYFSLFSFWCVFECCYCWCLPVRLTRPALIYIPKKKGAFLFLLSRKSDGQPEGKGVVKFRCVWVEAEECVQGLHQSIPPPLLGSSSLLLVVQFASKFRCRRDSAAKLTQTQPWVHQYIRTPFGNQRRAASTEVAGGSVT